MEQRQPADEIIKGLTTKADKIRATAPKSASLWASVTSKSVMCFFALGSRAVYAGRSRSNVNP
jgi:hypothetical protein